MSSPVCESLGVEFDRFTIALLLTNPEAPELDDETAAAVQDAHLAHLADLHAAGVLLAAGPLSDPDGRVRGLAILNVDQDEARRLNEQDPAVEAGVFRIQTLPWLVPAGALSLASAFFPRSVADVTER
jgi:uncharacterized protein